MADPNPSRQWGPPVEISAELVERTYKAVKLRASVPRPDGPPRIVTGWVPFALATWAGKGKWAMPEAIAREKGFM